MKKKLLAPILIAYFVGCYSAYVEERRLFIEYNHVYTKKDRLVLMAFSSLSWVTFITVEAIDFVESQGETKADW